jgi:hypothetical protein
MKNIYLSPTSIFITVIIFLTGCSAEENIYYQNGMKSYDAGDMKNSFVTGKYGE